MATSSVQDVLTPQRVLVHWPINTKHLPPRLFNYPFIFTTSRNTFIDVLLYNATAPKCPYFLILPPIFRSQIGFLKIIIYYDST